MKILVFFPFSDFVIANDLTSTSRHQGILSYVSIDCSSVCAHANVGFYFEGKNFSSILVVSNTFPRMNQILGTGGCYSQQERIIFWTRLNFKWEKSSLVSIYHLLTQG